MLPDDILENPDAIAVQSDVVTGKFALGELTLEIAPSRIVEVCLRMKTDRQFIRMADLTAVDRYPEEPRFEIVYHLHSIERNLRIRLKCRVSSEIDSVTSVWRGANWFEREIFDLFGVRFRNHPDMRRIMLPDDYEGHPLRKDYPITGSRV